ncbi:MAG: phosphoglycerate kinase [Cyanobacteria bacterium]|nr:phosphoglycerate kinase [Cyanobacteriota bacterium]
MTLPEYQTIRDIPQWEGKRALVRVDFNVPFNEQHQITDDSRMKETLPTLQYLLHQGAKVILMSHLGRPKGKPTPEFSLKPVADHLKTLLGNTPVHFVNSVFSPEVQDAVSKLPNSEVLMIENVRFDPREEKNDPELSKAFASLGDIFVNDAFGSAHRAHASTEGVGHFLFHKVAGFLMEKEIRSLGMVLNNPKKPFTAIIGGSKVSSKITVLEALLDKVDHLVIGGGMLFTFLQAQGVSVGKSMVEPDFVETAKHLLQKAAEKGSRILLAVDVVVADGFKADAAFKTVSIDEIPSDWMGLDIGPKSIQEIQAVLKTSQTILWNGPLGVFEFPNFATGTQEIASTIAQLTQETGCQSVLGGGDTVAAIEQFKMDPNLFTHVSSGGGASLEFLEGKALPGIAILDLMPVKSSV